MAHRLALVTACGAFLLIIAGGLVTSTHSGMATEHHVAMPGGFEGTKLYEHGHRILGWIVGFLVLCTTILILAKEKKTWPRRLAIASFAAVAAQGLLGMLTVKLELRMPAVSIAHAGLAQITFSLLVALAIITSPRFSPKAVQRIAVVMFAIVFVQILLGAWYRHSNATIALLAHFAGVFAVGGAAFLMRNAKWLHLVFALQIVLGPLALVLRKPKEIYAAEPLPLAYAVPVTAHVAMGALMMAAAVFYVLNPAPVELQPEPSLT